MSARTITFHQIGDSGRQAMLFLHNVQTGQVTDAFEFGSLADRDAAFRTHMGPIGGRIIHKGRMNGNRISMEPRADYVVILAANLPLLGATNNTTITPHQ